MILNPTSLSRKVAFQMKKEDFELLSRFVAILHMNMRAFFSTSRPSAKEEKVRRELTTLLLRMVAQNCGDCELTTISPEVQETCLSMFRE